MKQSDLRKIITEEVEGMLNMLGTAMAEGKGQDLADKYVAKLRSEFRKLNDDELDEFRKTIAQAFDLKESVNEAKVNYNFSEDELKRVLKLLGRNASTEVKMIKAFEKAFGRKLTRDEMFESVNEGSTYRVYMNSDMDRPKEIDYEIYFGDGTKAEMIKQAKKMVKSKTNQYGDPILVKVVHEDDIDDVAFTNESVNEGPAPVPAPAPAPAAVAVVAAAACDCGQSRHNARGPH